MKGVIVVSSDPVLQAVELKSSVTLLANCSRSLLRQRAAPAARRTKRRDAPSPNQIKLRA
jgi:hypothetical protein